MSRLTLLTKILRSLTLPLTTHDPTSVSANLAVPGPNLNLVYMNNQLVPDKIVVDAISGYATTIPPLLRSWGVIPRPTHTTGCAAAEAGFEGVERGGAERAMEVGN